MKDKNKYTGFNHSKGGTLTIKDLENAVKAVRKMKNEPIYLT